MQASVSLTFGHTQTWATLLDEIPILLGCRETFLASIVLDRGKGLDLDS